VLMCAGARERGRVSVRVSVSACACACVRMLQRARQSERERGRWRASERESAREIERASERDPREMEPRSDFIDVFDLFFATTTICWEGVEKKEISNFLFSNLLRLFCPTQGMSCNPEAV